MVSSRVGTTTYTYDSDDRVETLTDPRGLVTTFSYSGEHLATITDPAGRTTFLTHDAAGNLTDIIDPDGSTRQFTYDTNHRMTWRCCIIPKPNKLSTVMCMLRAFSLTPAYPNSSFDLKWHTSSVLQPSDCQTAELVVRGRTGL